VEVGVLETVVVFSGGPRPAPSVVAALPQGAPIVAADRGAGHALELGLRVEVAVGDFDSISPESLALLEVSGARIERHASEKDATDLELALDAAAKLAPRRILVVGGSGGRIDHQLGELLLLGAEAYAEFELDALLGRATVHVIRGERRLRGRPGELISLLPLHGEAADVVSHGLVYPLRGERLGAGSSRGVSNLFDAEAALVTLGNGVLVAVRPGGRLSLRALGRARRSVREGSESS
jgi:thiamine pyrophosphokinase